METEFDRVEECFEGADVSLIKEIIYFDGWSTYEECGGYLIFLAIDDSYQLAEYGYCVMIEDNTNYFDLIELTKDEVDEKIAYMDQCINDPKYM